MTRPTKRKFLVFEGEATAALDTVQVVIAGGSKKARVVTQSYTVHKSSSTQPPASSPAEPFPVPPNETPSQAATDPPEGDGSTTLLDAEERLRKVRSSTLYDFLSATDRKHIDRIRQS